MSWQEKPLKEIVDFPPKVVLEKNEVYDFIPMDIIDGGVKYISNMERKEYTGGGTKFANGDTLFARITPCLENGKIAMVKNLEKVVGFGSTEYFVFRAKEGISDPDYIYYLAKSDIIRQPAIKSMVGASGRQRADKGVTEEIIVPYPPLPTQQRIASILSTYDDLIENNLKRIKLLEEAAQNIYKEWFINFRFPNYEKTKFENGLPKGWEKTPLSNVIDYKEGPGLRNWQFRDNGIPFLNIRVMGESEIDFAQIKYLDENEVEKKYKHFLLQENDHVISTSGTLGKVVTIRKSHLPLCLNTSIIRMRQKSDLMGTWQIKRLIKSDLFLNTMKSFAIGAAQLNFGPKHLEMMEVNTPTREISSAYEKYTEPLEVQILMLLDYNRILKEARDILLPRLMNRTIEV